MPELTFQVESAEPVMFAASPLLSLRIRIDNHEQSTPVQSIALRCQIQIEPTQRRYLPGEQQKLVDELSAMSFPPINR